MAGNLGASTDEIAWVSTGYILSNVIVLPMTAWLSGRFGRRRYLLASIVIFNIARLMCGLSGSLGEIIFWRLVQGAGGVALISTAQSTLVEIFPRNQTAMVQSLFGLGLIVTPTLGPALGGYITDHSSWRTVFFVHIPLALGLGILDRTVQRQAMTMAYNNALIRRRMCMSFCRRAFRRKETTMRITVTLARQLGCGGSYLGQEVANHLQVRCLDREIVSRTAQQLALDEEELAEREERGTSFWERMLRGISGPPEALYQPPLTLTVTDQELFAAETEVMKQIAAAEDCVIVGRLASHVLPSHPGMVNVFLYAPLDFRVGYVRMRHPGTSEAQARSLVLQSDETRKRYITQMVGKGWDDARNYHLCLDTSSLPLPQIAELLTDYVRRKIACP